MQKRETQSVSKWHRFRSSKRFIYIVVNLAVFTDAYLYGLIIPVLPFALSDFADVPSQDLQKWIAILLGAYGAGLIIGSRTPSIILPTLLPPFPLPLEGDR